MKRQKDASTNNRHLRNVPSPPSPFKEHAAMHKQAASIRKSIVAIRTMQPQVHIGVHRHSIVLK